MQYYIKLGTGLLYLSKTPVPISVNMYSQYVFIELNQEVHILKRTVKLIHYSQDAHSQIVLLHSTWLWK